MRLNRFVHYASDSRVYENRQFLAKFYLQFRSGVVILWRIKIDFIVMAKPIKETPVLTGKDAERFARSVESPRVVSKEEARRAREAYEEFKKIATFAL